MTEDEMMEFTQFAIRCALDDFACRLYHTALGYGGSNLTKTRSGEAVAEIVASTMHDHLKGTGRSFTEVYALWKDKEGAW